MIRIKNNRTLIQYIKNNKKTILIHYTSSTSKDDKNELITKQVDKAKEQIFNQLKKNHPLSRGKFNDIYEKEFKDNKAFLNFCKKKNLIVIKRKSTSKLFSSIFSRALKDLKKYKPKEYVVSEDLISDKSIKEAVNKYNQDYKLNNNNELIVNKTHSTLIKHQIVTDKILQETKKQFGTTLFQFSSGGGGHKTAKNSLVSLKLKEIKNHILYQQVNKFGRQEANRLFNIQFPKNEDFLNFCKENKLIIERDTLHDYLGRTGKAATRQWDKAQQNNNTKKLKSLANKQWMSEKVFYKSVYRQTLKDLRKYKPKQMNSTQAMCNHAVLRAIKQYNKEEKTNLKLDLYMTDLVTPSATHFTKFIKKINGRKPSKKNTSNKKNTISRIDFLRLHVPNQPDKNFIETLTSKGFETKNLIVPTDSSPNPLVHPVYTNYDINQFSLNKVSIKANETERELLKELGAITSIGNTDIFDYQMGEEDPASFIMLGSQPSDATISAYVKEYIKLANEKPSETHHLFLFSGKYSEDKGEIYQKVIKQIKQIKKDEGGQFPTNLKVLPLSYQSPEQLINLYLRCSTITRSGGLTSMELLYVHELQNKINKKFPNHNPKRFIHAETTKSADETEGILNWERGNYDYLNQNIGANVLTPKSFINKFSKNEEYEEYSKLEFQEQDQEQDALNPQLSLYDELDTLFKDPSNTRTRALRHPLTIPEREIIG